MTLSPEQFSDDPLAFAESGRVQKLLCGHALSEFAGCEAAMKRLRDYASESFRLPDLSPAWQNDKVASGMALMDFDALKKLEAWIGALRYASAMRHVIDGDIREKLKGKFPGVYPECLLEAPNFRRWLKRCSEKSSGELKQNEAECIRDFGEGVVMKVMRRVPGILERWCLRMTEMEAERRMALTLPDDECLPDDSVIEQLMQI